MSKSPTERNAVNMPVCDAAAEILLEMWIKTFGRNLSDRLASASTMKKI